MTCFTQGDDLKSRAVLFYFFDTKEEIAKKASILSTLEIYLEENDDDGLCQYLKMLVSDLTDDLTDEAIEDIYSQFLNSDDSENFKNSGTDDTRISVLKEGVTNGAHTVFRVLNEVGTDYFKGVLRSVPFLKDTSIIVTSFYLTSESIGSIKQWYYGEITGQRCLKNILDSAITLGGSISGGAAGGAIGSFGGPVGFAIGRYIFSLKFSLFKSTLTDTISIQNRSVARVRKTSEMKCFMI